MSAENRQAIIAHRMGQWLQLAVGAIERYDRARGLKNYLRLIRHHPDIATKFGFEPGRAK
jgi:hypothetical protein